MSQTDEDVDDLPTDTESEGKTDETQQAEETQQTEEESEQLGEQEQEQELEQEPEQGEEEESEEPEAKLEAESETEIGTIDAEELGEGEGEDEMEEEEIEEEEPSYYDPDDFISGAKICKGGTLPIDILEFDFSYGYDCRKNFNLTVLDDEIIVFASGNFINFFNVVTREIWFRRSALGGGIGHIKKNPKAEYPYFAIAECGGRRPLIILYEWPTMEILCILKGGSARLYSNLDYSPDGELLVSQGGEPDYMITIWNWREHKIILRAKSYINEIYRVKFSPYVPGQLTTCGLAHIKFWKMAITFTGLKLKGELGRFGKTEYSDIYGVLPMPDEKVLSGCNWGNILVWDAGLISLEVYRSQRKTCHDGPIVQMYYEEEVLWTVSMDGHVRVWWYENIDQADPPDDDRVVLLDPSYDFYTPGVMLMSIEKRYPHDETDKFYYGQDGNGGIWLIDLNTEEEPVPSVQLYRCHAGSVMDLAICPFGPYFASIGGGRIFIYNYLEKTRIYEHDLPAKGTCLIWLPLDMVNTADIILAGSDDGQIRVCCIQFKNDGTIKMFIMQVIKPHNKPLTAMSINPSGTILVSGGEDMTIFIFKLDKDEYSDEFLVPIGFIPAPDIVTCITWHYENDAEVLVGCMHGKMMQVEVPYNVQPYTGISFLLDLAPQLNAFKTYKSQIRRDIKIREIEDRKAKKLAKKMEELAKVKKENPGLEVDEEAFLADSDSEEELEPLFIPEVPNKILWLRYTDDKTIWLSMGGFDAGYIYEYLIDQKDDAPYRFKMVYEADDIEISSYVYSKNNEYIIFAMEDGTIRVNKVNPEDFRDLSDYWTLSMHDNQNGFVPKMCFSWDEHYFFSCGHDGNVFAYKFQPPEEYLNPEPPTPKQRRSRPFNVKDVDAYSKLSLEETKIKAENDRVLKLANQRKAKVREILKNLRQRYSRVLARNAKMLPSQMIPREELELDERVYEEVENGFEEKLSLVNRRLAYDVEKSGVRMRKLLGHFTEPCDMHPIILRGINDPNQLVVTVRQRKIRSEFYEMLEYVSERCIAEQSKGRPPERLYAHRKLLPPKAAKVTALEYFLLSLSPSVISHNLGPKLTRMLNKYRERVAKWDHRLEEWEEFIAKKPIEGKNHPDDEKLLAEAKDTIGDYKLKESDDYKVSHEEKETTVKKYKQLLEARLKQYYLRHEFTKKVWDLRDKKYIVRDHLVQLRNETLIANEELPESFRSLGPDVPEVDMQEYPEKNLTPNVVIPEVSVFEEATMEEQKFIEKPTPDIKEQELIPETIFPVLEGNIFRCPIDEVTIGNVSHLDIRTLLSFSEEEDTPYEMDVKARRLTRKLFVQTENIKSMNHEIEKFNKSIDTLKVDRLPTQVKGNYIDLYILTLNQELNILKLSEDIEDNLTEKVNDNLSIVHDMEDVLDALNHKMATHQQEIENCRLEETKIQDRFKHATENNKFYDFLRKVFKKKFKMPKVRGDDDDSSSSSSSSSSEEDDAASQDSEDFTIIKQDLNVCPKGCEQAIFNLTIDLRTERHHYEQTAIEENRLLEIVKKDINLNNRKLLMLQKNLQISANELEIFQREKQRKLNLVKCTVLLRLDQIYGFNPGTSDITEFLVFSKTILSKLYKRVGILQIETFEQRGKHDTYMKHLMRMHKDMKYMKKKMKELERDQVNLMKTKFGKVVDINEIDAAILKRSFKKTHVNELEEVMLKKLVFDLRIKSTDLKEIYAAELNDWKVKIRHSQTELLIVIKENTKRLDLLKVLNREKKELAEVLTIQPGKRQHIETLEKAAKDCLEDVSKLEEILEKQCEELQELKSEIKMLRTKGLPPRTPKEQKPEETILDEKEWMQHLYTVEEDEEERPFADISIPGYFSTESQDLVTELITTLMEKLDTQLERRSKENLVRNILSGILKCVSVTDIINEILNSIPFEPTEGERGLIESTAEKLYGIQEPDLTPDTIDKYTAELLEEIVDEVMLIKGEPHEVIFRMVKKLVYSVPYGYLMQEGSLDRIIGRLSSAIGGEDLSKEGLAKATDSIPSIYREEMMAVLDIILERVYGLGIDYLYVIKY